MRAECKLDAAAPRPAPKIVLDRRAIVLLRTSYNKDVAIVPDELADVARDPHALPLRETKYLGRMPIDQLKTVRDLAPRFWRVVSDLRPTFHLDSAAVIDLRFATEHAIRGIVWDVDGTLMGYHRKAVDEAIRATFDELVAAPSVRHAIVSNCDEIRFLELGELFPSIPVLRGYEVEHDYVFRSLASGVDTHTASEIDVIIRHGRQLRKPSGELMRYAADVLGLPPGDILVVGDQYMTDVASARLAGARSAKVPTLRPETFPRSIRFTQQLERTIYRLRHGRAGSLRN